MKSLFLICALALPAASFTTNNDWKKEYDMLITFIRERVPDAQIYIGEDRKPGIEWEKVPFTWRENYIYIKRPDIRISA
jgi:hypothetical protein